MSRTAQLLAALTACVSCAAPDNLVVGRAPNGGAVKPATNTTPAPNLLDASAMPIAMMGAAGASSATHADTNTDASAPINAVSIDQTKSDNPAGLSSGDVATLVAGGPLGDMKWLYPCEGTVFPRGTITPLVMWHSSAAPDAVYFHMKSQAFEYKGVLAPAADAALVRGTGMAPLGGLASANALAGEHQTQLAIPQDIWERAGQQTLGKADPFTLELTERVNGVIHGPIVSRITIAQANFKGSVYYDSCASALTNASATDALSTLTGENGRVLRIPAGGKAELVLALDTCHGCHSVSADGSRLLAQEMPAQGNLLTGAAMQDPNYAKGQARSYQLGVDGKLMSSAGDPVGGNASYGALYPDGSKYLTTAVQARPVTGDLDEAASLTFGVGMIHAWGGYEGDASAAFDFSPATLYDASSGQVVADTGIPTGAMMPMFSPDGTRLVFNDIAIDDARGLAVMSYDTHAHKASQYRPLVQEASTGTLRPGWPAFLPDNGAVVFVRTQTKSFTADTIATSTTSCANLDGGCGNPAFGNMAADGGTADPNAELSLGKASDLYIADMNTGAVTLLAKAMGFDSPEVADSGATYLPFGAQDLHHNYFPTVSPVAAGGYFWVFFDTRRNFGSLGMQRALWGFAIDIQPDGNYTRDTSHPAFYLPGQEFGTSSDNHRAFAALDRCRPDQALCATGIDCCSGHCENAACATPPVQSCARLDERCASAANCCDSANYCINGFCAVVDLL